MTPALHPETEKMIDAFARSLKVKLARAEAKYGYSDNWRTDDWEADCQRDLAKHVAKGDPLDVAAYAAFCWARGYPTAPVAGLTSEERNNLPATAPGHWDTPEGREMAQATLDDPHMAASRARVSDFALANRVFLSPDIGNLTDAKERIRWLSVMLATSPVATATASVREPWPGYTADMERRRVVTLAKVGQMLSIMAGGEAAEVEGYDAADLYADVLMALGIEDAAFPDLALQGAEDDPEAYFLTDSGTSATIGGERA